MATSRSSGEPLLLPAAAFALPLAFGPLFRDAWGAPKVAAAAGFSIAGALALARSGELFSLRSRVDLPLAAFCAAAAVSAALSLDRDLSLFGHRAEYLFGLSGLAACLAAFALGCAHARGGVERLSRWAVAGSVVVCVYALLQAAGVEPLSWRPGGGALVWAPSGVEGRAASTFGNPVELGAYLAMILPLALGLALESGERKTWPAAVLLVAAALVATRSRGAIAAGAIGGLVVAARRSPRAAAGVAAAGALGLLLAYGARATGARSDSLRAAIWRVGLSQTAEAPWLGTGPGTFVVGFRAHKDADYARLARQEGEGLPRNAHNDWLEAFATTGALGLAAYAWLNASGASGAARALAGKPGTLHAGLAGAVLALALVAKVNSPFFAPAWLASAFAGCVLALPPRAGARGAAAGALVLAACGWAGWTAWQWARGEREDALGRLARDAGRPRSAVEHFERALSARPAEAAYVQDLANTLWDAASALPPGARAPLLARASSAAREGLRRRPLDAELRRLLGEAELRRVELGERGRLEEASRAVAAAEALEPDFVTIQDMKRRLNTWRARK